jgi:hypothetical protein
MQRSYVVSILLVGGRLLILKHTMQMSLDQHLAIRPKRLGYHRSASRRVLANQTTPSDFREIPRLEHRLGPAVQSYAAVIGIP